MNNVDEITFLQLSYFLHIVYIMFIFSFSKQKHSMDIVTWVYV